jgi:hypothetical protein
MDVKLGLLWGRNIDWGCWGDYLQLRESEDNCNEGVHKFYKWKVNVTLSLCLMGEWRYNSTTPDLRTSCRWLVSFTPRPLYSGKEAWHSFDGKLCGPRASLDIEEERKISYPAGNRTPVVQPVAHRYTDWAISAFLHKFCCTVNIKSRKL